MQELQRGFVNCNHLSSKHCFDRILRRQLRNTSDGFRKEIVGIFFRPRPDKGIRDLNKSAVSRLGCASPGNLRASAYQAIETLFTGVCLRDFALALRREQSRAHCWHRF